MIQTEMEVKTSYTWNEGIRLYLEHHPEVFTDEFMEELADRFLNCNTIRQTFKAIYPAILANDILPNADIIPSNIWEKK